jgi:ATP-dependent Clp protease ATP-binding subunit ClpC
LRVIELSLAAMLSGTKYRGDFEERVDSLLRAASADPNVVLFIDELHTVVGAGATAGGVDAANLLKPALARGDLRCIGATTPEEYRERIEKDPALSRRFQPVRVEEPTPEQARTMLSAAREGLENHHDIVISDEAIDAAVELSVRYLPDRRLPDKARDLVDQASSARRFVTFTPRGDNATQPTTLRREDIARVVEEWTGVPVATMAEVQQDRLADAESYLRRRVIGQEAALAIVAQRGPRVRLGARAPWKTAGRAALSRPHRSGKDRARKVARRAALRRRARSCAST